MTGITHQLFALLLALWALTLYPASLGLTAGIIAIIAVMVGALTPDLDQPAANIWKRLLGGRAIGRIFQTFSGGHRHLIHSVIGIVAVGLLLRWGITTLFRPEIVPQAMIVWYAYMIGYISHPLADTVTDWGVPWLWPLATHIKIPPGPEEVRVTTDSFVERIFFRGGVIIALLLLLLTKWSIVAALFS